MYGLVDILLIRIDSIEKGVDRGDDMPCRWTGWEW